MEYISGYKTAKRWGVLVTAVFRAAREVRILGAKQVGQTWYIPVDATKPVDEQAGR